MARQAYPWPVEQIRQWYEVEGKTLEEVASLLGADDFQPYWLQHLGHEYRPTAKTVNSACKRKGFVALRKTGATGIRNGSYRGFRTTDKHGYVLVRMPDHPRANSSGYVREHRIVAEKALGRYLLPTEVVHHVDDNPANNSPENLVVYDTNGKHLAETLKGKCPDWTDEGRRAIAAGVEKAARNRRAKTTAASTLQAS